MTKKITLSYRPDIDGLRALAVLAVVTYHAELIFADKMMVPGGFIGVDIFFVISGYLITRLIATEIENTAKFDYSNFFLRRARRLLPVLLTVILFSLVVATFHFLPGGLVDLSESAISAIGFSSNIYFFLNSVSYGDDDGLLRPLLHTWSLGVEEQFYLVAPALIVYLRLFGKTFSTVFLCVLGTLSLLLYSAIVIDRPNFGFFMPFTRFWELMFGAILAYSEVRTVKGRFTGCVSQALAKGVTTGALLLILLSIFLLEKTDHGSALTIMVPIASTTVLIALCDVDHPAYKLLSSKSVLAVGLSSYSLYLWHFPFIAFSQSVGLMQDNISKLCIILLSMCVAFISYRFIETPFRRQNVLSTVRFLKIVIPIAIVTSGICLLTIYSDGWPNRIPGNLASADTLEDIKDDSGFCHDRTENFCRFVTDETLPTIVMIGDSHFLALSKDLKERVNNKFNLVLANLGGCPFALGVDRIDGAGNVEDCNAELQLRRLSLLTDKKSILVTGGRLPLYLSRQYFDNQEGAKEGEEFEKNFVSQNGDPLSTRITATLQQILYQGHHIIFIYPIPEVGFNVPQTVFSELNRMNSFDQISQMQPLTTSSKVYNQRTHSTFELIGKIDHERFHRVFPHQLFCDTDIENRCTTHKGTNLFYQDDDHPGGVGDDMINKLIVETLNDKIVGQL